MALDKNPISPTSIITSSARQWEERISNVFKNEGEIQFDHLPPLCVFQVPKLLIDQNQESYTPQLIGMGPYHHLNPDLYHMERYKLAAIKQILDPSQILNFQHIVVDKLKQIDPMIRACYGRFMDLQEGTLAWIIAIDGLFLINILHTLLSSSYDYCRSDNILTRDIILLENQIPVVLLKEILKLVELSSPSSDYDDAVFSMLLRFCETHSPLKISMESRNFNDFPQPLHLLDLMYHLIVKDQGPAFCVEVPIQDISIQNPDRIINQEDEDDQDHGTFQNFEDIIDVVESLGLKPTQKIMKPVKVVTNVIPWTTISGLFRTATKIDGDDEDEITIPSVTSLRRYARVTCSPILKGGIKNIKFDEKETTLYLPIITLNSCSEVILRNLVAYEAAMLKSTLEFARYVNLMNGIVDTAEDVRILRKNGIIKGNLGDQESADLFNSMKRFFAKPDKRSNIEVAIKKINEYYDTRMVVRVYRRMKKNAVFSWKILAIVSFILTITMLAFQTFCESYNCGRLWGLR